MIPEPAIIHSHSDADPHQGVRDWFDHYTRTWLAERPDCRDPFQLKIDHSRRVAEEALDLAHDLGCSADQVQLAGTMGLLHDIGRFDQFARYGTFRDDRSLDHGLHAVRVIDTHRVLDAFPGADRQLIRTAVRLHNKARVPEGENRRRAFFTRLLRDADKLDIYHVILTEYRRPTRIKTIVNGPDTGSPHEISPPVAEAIRARRIVGNRDARTRHDMLLLRMGWVFDINFPHTFRRLIQRGHIAALGRRLPPTHEAGELLRIIQDHVVKGAQR